MSQTAPTAARVYIDGGPTVRLRLPVDGEDKVYQTQDEMRADVAVHLKLGYPLDYMTVDGEGIVIPAKRVIDVVFPPISRDGLDEDQINAKAWLETKGTIHTARMTAGDEFVEAYLANSGFGGEVLVQIREDLQILAEITGYKNPTKDTPGVFILDNVGVGGILRLTVDEIYGVVCWEAEDYRHGECDDALTEVGRTYMEAHGIPRDRLGLPSVD